MPVIDAINIGEQDERVGLHHLGNEAGEFVVIRKHQLSDGNSVVLVDDRQDIVLQHHCHAGSLVTVLFARFEVLLHGKHLPDVDAELAEQIVVESHKFHLTYCGEKLSLLYGVE